MAQGAKRLLSENQFQDEFDYLEKAAVRYRRVIIAYILLICLSKLTLGLKDSLFYLTSGCYIIYLTFIELVSFFKVNLSSNFFRIVRVEANIFFSSLLLYLGNTTFEFYLLFIPWIIASSIFFNKTISLIIVTQISIIYISISLITFEKPIENIHFSSSVTRTLLLFLIWGLSRWWWERRMLSQKRKNRLKVLHEFQMEAMNLNIKELFKRVVKLTYNLLNSEESALFLQDPKDSDTIVKVAIKAPSPEIESELIKRKEKFKSGESLTGSVFKNQKSIIVPNVEKDPSAKKDIVDRYREILPSGKIQHYIGVPLIIENEVLGVLRVTNRKSPNYSLDNRIFQLCNKGFDEEDRILLEIIAREVTIAIKNAKTKNYFEHLLDNTDEAVIALDQNGIIQQFNKSAERIFGYRAEEVIGTDVREHYKDAGEAYRIMELLKSSKDGRISNVAAFVKAIDGEIIPIDLSACLLSDETGEMLGSLGLFRDLRVLKALQDRVIQSERMAAMGVLARSVGHELKHDFNTIILYAEALDGLV